MQAQNLLFILSDEHNRDITGCYGSLTSFNALFADEEDQFKGGGAED